MKTLTPLGSPSSDNSTQLSLLVQTPLNLREFQCYLISLKKHLNPLFSNPSNPTLTALSWLYKGYRMVMYNGVVLVKENIDLHIAIDLQEHKRNHPRKTIVYGNGSLNVEEAISLI